MRRDRFIVGSTTLESVEDGFCLTREPGVARNVCFCGRRHLFILLLLRRRIPRSSRRRALVYLLYEARFRFFSCVMGVDISLEEWA